MNGSGIDETLLAPRRVVRWTPDDEGLGYELDLECGHAVWMAIAPPASTYCGVCLNALIEQARELQARQRV